MKLALQTFLGCAAPTAVLVCYATGSAWFDRLPQKTILCCSTMIYISFITNCIIIRDDPGTQAFQQCVIFLSASITISYHKIIGENSIVQPDDIVVESIKLERQDDDNHEDRIIKTFTAQQFGEIMMEAIHKGHTSP